MLSLCESMCALMYDASYWHRYFMARHHVSLIMGIVLMGGVLLSILTGYSLTRYRGIVSRAEDPKMFWETVVTYGVLGLVCFGLYLYTSN